MTTALLNSNIIYLSEAREKRFFQGPVSRGTEKHERRRAFRRESGERLFLQIVHSADPDLLGTTISCTAIDVSAGGLRVACDISIPVGCLIDLWVDDTKRPGKFFLSSRVCWAMHNASHGFEIGVELMDGAATDIDEWRERQG